MQLLCSGAFQQNYNHSDRWWCSGGHQSECMVSGLWFQETFSDFRVNSHKQPFNWIRTELKDYLLYTSSMRMQETRVCMVPGFVKMRGYFSHLWFNQSLGISSTVLPFILNSSLKCSFHLLCTSSFPVSTSSSFASILAWVPFSPLPLSAKTYLCY